MTEPVIKFITVRTDEELKRLDKIKKIRDARKKASAAPAAPGDSGSGVRNRPRRRCKSRAEHGNFISVDWRG